MTPLEDIVKKEKEKLKRALPKAAQKIGNDIGNKFIKTINAFYNHYKPKYGRTQSLYDQGYGVNGRKRYVKKIGSGYTCGIRVDPSFVSGNPYKKNHGWKDLTPSDVYWISIVGGFHGYYADVLDPGKEKYIPKTIPPVMSPSPEQIMDKFFDDYTLDYVVGVIESFM